MTTATQVIEEVRRLAAEQPDFVYAEQEGANPNEDCSYFGCHLGNTAGQACIVGQALANLNVDMAKLEEAEDSGNDTDIDSVLVSGIVNITYTSEEAKWLGNVQYHQDRKEPWARAVELADKAVRPWN